MASKGKCEFCARPAFYRESQLCKRCYAYAYYWNRKSVTDQVKHGRNLDRRSRTLDAVLAAKRKKRRRKAG